MNKTKYLTIRVTEKEMMAIRGKAGSDNLSVSEWVLKCLLEDLEKKLEGANSIKKDAIRRMDKQVRDGEIGIELKMSGPQCQSPGCPSYATKPYDRATGKFWLCDTHKP